MKLFNHHPGPPPPPPANAETALLLLGRFMSGQNTGKNEIRSLAELEFKVFSQWGDDGIIQWLVQHLDIPNQTFIEFGVENYRESNTRFLLMNNNWSGFILDGTPKNISRIQNSEYYWQYELETHTAFIDAENVNELLRMSNFEEDVGLLSIDLDGIDYWVWKSIDCIRPVIAIIEYNSVFGAERAVTIPYDRFFRRTKAHYSNLYWGASLPALHRLGAEKGYAFIGCNSAGNNAYFVRSDRLNASVREVPLEQGYVSSKFRENRDRDGQLSHVSGAARLELIRGMPVYNIISERTEPL
jgi:hypothetical protein